MTEEGISDILKAGELVLDVIPFVNVAALQYISVEEVLASLHHYTTKVDTHL